MNQPVLPGCHQLDFLRGYLNEAIKEYSEELGDWDADMQRESKLEAYQEILDVINEAFRREWI